MLMTNPKGQSLRPNDDSNRFELSPDADESARASLALEALGGSAKLRQTNDSKAAQIDDQSERKQLEKAKDEFALKHQILISQDATGKQLTYTVRSGASNIDILTSDNSREALATAEKQIEQLTKAKEQQLNTDFKLRFSQDNEEVVGQVAIAPDGTFSHGKMIYARAPYLSELYGIESVMERAVPSQLAKDGKDGKDGKQGVKFYFLKDSLYQDDHGSIATYINSDKEDKPAIYVSKDGIGATLVKKGESFEWQGGIDAHMLLHEFSHNSQVRLGLNEEKRLIQFSNRCGFAPFERPGTSETIWALRSKDGKLYRLDKEIGGWQHIDDKGNLVKSDKSTNLANLAKPNTDKTEILDDIEMAKQAEVRPPTFYFDNPLEMAAEGMAMLKEGASSRKELLIKTPVFYQFIKEQDQIDINLAFGLDPNGKAKLIRRPDGKLTANDDAAQKIILEFEK